MNKTAMEWAKLQQSERESKRALLGKALPTLKFAPRLQDVSFYLKVIKDAASFATLPTTFETGTVLPDFPVSRDVGGIAIIYYIPTIGKQYGSNNFRRATSNPIYYALNEFLSQCRKRNSRVGGYEPSEVGIYLLGVTDIYEDLFRAELLLKLLHSNEALDQYAGYNVLRSLGFDPLVEKGLSADLENDLRTMIEDAELNLPLPYQLTYLKRRHYLATTILGDHAGERRDLYLFWKEGYFDYEDVLNELTWVNDPYGPSHPHTIRRFLDILQSRIDRFKDSATVTQFVDDFRSAVDESKFYHFPDWDTSRVEIDSSDEKLDQVHNLMTVPFNTPTRYPQSNSVRVWVNSNGWLMQGLKSRPTEPGVRFELGVPAIASTAEEKALFISQYNAAFAGKQFPLNYFKPRQAITAEDNIVATRFRSDWKATSYTDGGTTHYDLLCTDCGTEIVSNIGMYYIDHVNDTIEEAATASIHFSPTGDYNQRNRRIRLSNSSHFDWMPLQLVIECEPTGSGNTLDFHIPEAIEDAYWFGEFATYIPISDANLTMIHSNAVKSEFYIEPEDFLPPVR